ncbi:hypothetical protein AM593_05977, partial [Mytilus galloprovincialis]
MHIRHYLFPDKPVIEFNFPDKSHFIQGESKQLCCSSDSRPSTKKIWMFKDKEGIRETHYKSICCITLINISDSDSGIYSCFAENELGISDQEIIINVMCKKWDHRSYFNEHIRYLNSTSDGKLLLPMSESNIGKSDNRGIYVCSASNGVPDLHGNKFQFGEIVVLWEEIEIPRALGLVKRFKNKRIQNPDDVIEVVGDSTDAVENVLYQSNAFRCNEATQRHTLTESAAVSNNQRSNPTNEENQRPQRLSNRFQDSTRQLNYADISFKPSLPGNEMRIRGLGNKTVYADVDFTNGRTGVIETLMN